MRVADRALGVLNDPGVLLGRVAGRCQEFDDDSSACFGLARLPYFPDTVSPELLLKLITVKLMHRNPHFARVEGTCMPF